MVNKNEQKKPIYLKTFTLRDAKDIYEIRTDIEKHMILIIRITPLAQRDVDELRIVVEELYKCVNSVGGDISRLGEERIIVTPPSVKIWHKGIDANS
ncbi:MAG: cell division protein SepF [Nitrosopumilus sp.]|nr:cell division protein SepF [Nitrosopumilus sp.]